MKIYFMGKRSKDSRTQEFKKYYPYRTDRLSLGGKLKMKEAGIN
jgi:hypothetical protein